MKPGTRRSGTMRKPASASPELAARQDAVGVNFVDTMFRDIIADLLDRIRLSGTLLFHYELSVVR